jgi:hypothetical protein
MPATRRAGEWVYVSAKEKFLLVVFLGEKDATASSL